MEQAFFDVGVIVGLAALFGVIARLLKQPLLVGYIVAGLVLGQFLVPGDGSNSLVHAFSTLGTTLLLFLVGLELDVRKIKALGQSALLVALGQLFFTSTAAFALARLVFHLDTLPALYLAIAVSLSSTIIVARELSSRHELSTLHGRLSVLILLVQDLAALFSILFLSNLSSQGDAGTAIFTTSLKFLVFVGAVVLISHNLLGRLFHKIARSEELLFLVALAWCLMLAIIAQSLGLTTQVGAFAAGLSLAPLPYSTHLSGRVMPLRDFFITIFFVGLGLSLNLSDSAISFSRAGLIFLLVIAIKPMVVYLLLVATNYRRRVAFLTASTQSQVSEFSLIILSLGLASGVISTALAAEITLAAAAAMLTSTYAMSFAHELYHLFSPILRLFHTGKREPKLDVTERKNHWVLFGADHAGSQLLSALKRAHRPVVAVDFDPDIVERLRDKCDILYGDMSDAEVLEEVGLRHAKHIISTVEDSHATLHLLAHLKRKRHRANIIVTAENLEEAPLFYKHGADFVIVPALLGADYVRDLLAGRLSGKAELDSSYLKKLKRAQTRHLEKMLES